jgi:anti-sigma regulatory factor (Ser/Thr protein kinase)
MASHHLARWRGSQTTSVVHTSVDMPQECRVLAEFRLDSVPGNERVAALRVIAVLNNLGLTQQRLQRLGTAVAEAALNAMEHGNHFDAHKQVEVRVLVDPMEVCVSISDEGCGVPHQTETPDISAKLAGSQTQRGWGLFLMSRMVDGFSDEIVDGRHAVLLRLHRVARTDRRSPA